LTEIASYDANPISHTKVFIMPPKFTKDQIVEAAFTIVRREGWRALTTRSIAEALGSSARPIYSFFNAMAEIEEQIVKLAVDLMHDYMTCKRTDDPWHDHGIGYVLFSMKEKPLFRSINDESHISCFKKYGDLIWTSLTAALSAYPPFQGLSKELIHQIQLHRWLFAHGLAFSASNPPPDTWTEQNIIAMIQQGSDAIYKGLVHQYASTQT
jgi:AcrR family transcriptional regulator